MTAFSAMLNGWKVSSKYFRIVFYDYLANVLLAALAAYPLYLLFQPSLNFSAGGRALSISLDFGYLIDFLHESGRAAASRSAGILIMALCFALVGVFIAGGAISLYTARRKGYDSPYFWGSCRRAFPVFMRLVFIAALANTLILVVAVGIRDLAAATQSGETMQTAPTILALLFTGFGISVVSLISDFAKVRLIVTGERGALEAFVAAGKGVLRHFGRAYGLQLDFLLLGAFVHLLYFAASDFVQPVDYFTAGVSLLLQQGFILLKLAIRLSFYAACVALHPTIFLNSASALAGTIQQRERQSKSME